MARTGRPKIPIDWQKFDALCAIQATEPEIAAVLGISENTIERAVKREHHMTFGAYYAEKRQNGLISLRRRQWQAAMAGSPALLIWLGKQHLKQAERHELTGPGGGPIQHEHTDLSHLSDEQLAQVKTIIESAAGSDAGGRDEGASQAASTAVHPVDET